MGDLALLIFNLALMVLGVALAPPSGPRLVGPTTVYEVRTATDEEIAAAAAELPELLRRAEEAAAGADRR